MARLTNAVRTLWSSQFETELDTLTSARSHSDYRFEGEIKKGATLNIIGVTKPTARALVIGTDITIDDVEDDKVVLNVDQTTYFAIKMEDVDKVQSEADIKLFAQEGVKALTDGADAYVCGLAAGATEVSASYEISPSTIVAELGKGFATLYSNNVSPKSELHLEVEPFFYNAMTQAITELNTSNPELIKEGYVGMYRSAKVSIENQLYVTGGDHYNMLRTRKAIAYVEQFYGIETDREEKGFKDIVKALMIYGAKLVRPEELYVIKSHVASV
jgi:hypothetical protein